MASFDALLISRSFMRCTLLALVAVILSHPCTLQGQITASISGTASVKGLGFDPAVNGGGRSKTKTLFGVGSKRVQLGDAPNSTGRQFASAEVRGVVGEGFLVLEGKYTQLGGHTAAASISADGFSGTISAEPGDVITTVFGSRVFGQAAVGNPGVSEDGGSITSFPVSEGQTEVTAQNIGFPSGVGFNNPINRNLFKSRRTDYYYWAVGPPGENGHASLPGSAATNPFRIPRAPREFGDFSSPQETQPSVPRILGESYGKGGQRQLTFPVTSGYGFNEPVFITSAESEAIDSAAREITGYEFYAPELGFKTFELVETHVADASYTLTSGDIEIQIGVGESVDLTAELGSAVESFIVSGIDAPLALGDALPFVAAIEFASVGVADLEIASLVEPAPPGDYSSDGLVSAADYVVWRDNLHQNVVLPGDVTPGYVSDEDFDAWLSNFGQSEAAFETAAVVPEPASLQALIVFAGMMAGSGIRFCRNS